MIAGAAGFVPGVRSFYLLGLDPGGAANMDRCELTGTGARSSSVSPGTQSNARGWRDVLLHLPVGVNCQSGDPFQPNQEPNTLAKLRALEASGHRGAVALITKWAVSDRTLQAIAQLDLDLFLFYSVTGLRESPIHTQEQTLASYLSACQILPKRRVAIVIRPIIPGQNDDLATLAPILDAAQQGQGLLIARGFRDRSWQLLTNQEFMSTLAQESERRGLRVFQRTVCLVGAMHGTACRLHGNGIDEAGLAVSAAFGYDVSLHTDPATGSRSVTVSAGTERLSMGDAHFVQILTGAEIRCDNPVSSNQLVHAKGPEGIALDCSSSWFTYARTTPCQVACFYCETAYRPRVWGEVGCVPLALTATAVIKT